MLWAHHTFMESDRNTESSDWPCPDSLDAVCAAPDSHRILLENGRVRVLEVIIPAGHKEPWHTHRRPSLMLVDESAAIRYFRSEDDFDEHPRAASDGGSPRLKWLGPEGIHCVENVDTVRYHAIRIELKGG
jgi:hypothetical protein